MFDDFMQNDFLEMHLNQAHQDAMLHAQNQAMQQTIGAQHRAREADRATLPKDSDSVLTTDNGAPSADWGLLSMILRRLFHWSSRQSNK